MPSHAADALPDIGEILGPIVLSLPRERQPLLIALAERRAAERYRGWAADPLNRAHAAALRACADREEEIAGRIEGLYPDAAAIQSEIIATVPGLEELNRSLFAGRPLADQFTIQARGERLGAATWRSFADQETRAEARATFLDCARLEEESAMVLESFLAQLDNPS